MGADEGLLFPPLREPGSPDFLGMLMHSKLGRLTHGPNGSYRLGLASLTNEMGFCYSILHAELTVDN
jgi:hypothetical protein